MSVSRRHMLWLPMCFCAALIGISVDGCAQSTGSIKATPGELVVDGWRLILPSVRIDEKTGQTWVRFDLPDGSYQSYPLDSGEPIVGKWFKPGVEGANTTPGGYSIEDTESITDWYMNGGVGEYVVEDGDWKPVDPTTIDSTPPEPASNDDYANIPGIESTTADEAADSYDSSLADSNDNGPAPVNEPAEDEGPFSAPVDPRAVQTVSTSTDSDLPKLAAEFRAAKELCKSKPTQENCERAYKLEAQYIAKTSGQ